MISMDFEALPIKFRLVDPVECFNMLCRREDLFAGSVIRGSP
jgi:hypothetical protein